MAKEILTKDKSYKISFKSNIQRDRAIKTLKDVGFNIDSNYTKTDGYLFLSTYDNLLIGGWDNKEIYQEKGFNKPISFLKLLDMCKGE